MTRFDVLTLFPEMFSGPFDLSIIKRAREKALVDINLHNLRRWATDTRGTVDDRPYGGGTGMILQIRPVFKALEAIKKQTPEAGKRKIILLDARGETFSQAKARDYASLEQLVIICGHYEGVDERVRDHLVDETISIGDYVLTGGEIPAMVIIDAVTRLIPGVLSKPEAVQIESFSAMNDERGSTANLEYPQYTRPEEFNGWKVPKILLSGNHQDIKNWKKENSKTKPAVKKISG